MLSNCKYIKERQGKSQSKLTSIFQQEYVFGGETSRENFSPMATLFKQEVQINSERVSGDTMDLERVSI